MFLFSLLYELEIIIFYFKKTETKESWFIVIASIFSLKYDNNFVYKFSYIEEEILLEKNSCIVDSI